MLCPKCGNESKKMFCENCGFSLTTTEKVRIKNIYKLLSIFFILFIGVGIYYLITMIEPMEEMVLIPEGEFEMGDKESELKCWKDLGILPAQKVFLKSYYIDKYEVTVGQFTDFLNKWGKIKDENGNQIINEQVFNYDFKFCDYYKSWGKWKPKFGRKRYPVREVSWCGANQYAKYNGKRLPTEAEWEKAARGTDGRMYPWGNEYDEKKVIDNFLPVGSIPSGASPYGVMDMIGGVYEWCSDEIKGGNDRTFVIFKGGNYSVNANNLKDWKRVSGKFFNDVPSWGPPGVGFRCVKDVK